MLLALLAAVPARADDGQIPDNAGRLIVIEENDKFGSGDDRHYTQGARTGWLTTPVTAGDASNGVYNWVSDNTPFFESGAGKRKIEWTALGQSIFTPANTAAAFPSLKDRPYGAWLYSGASLLQETPHETHDTLENAEVLGGVVGPLALGALTQNDFHQFIGVTPALGWTNQLHTEPGFALTYERKWRFQEPLGDSWAVDAIPEGGATLGNVFTYGELGTTFRVGQNLAADYGADHVRPSLSGTGWFDPSRMQGPLGWYVFGGAQGRAVGHNIFLDGNTAAPSPSVDKRPLVEDLVAGASVFWADDVRVDFTFTDRTKEFYSQQGSNDRFGSIGFTFGF